MKRSERTELSRATTKRRVKTRGVTAADWPIVERLFGSRGACGGCWCMWWRRPRGGKLWEESKGLKNKRAFKRLFTSGRVAGTLAFREDEPVGWCCIGPREDFPRLLKAKALDVGQPGSTWAVVCFYIPASERRRGVASALLKEAVREARRQGAKAIEGYPVRPSQSGDRLIPAAFAWTGVAALFEKRKFENVTPRGHSRDIYRRRLRPAKPR